MTIDNQFTGSICSLPEKSGSIIVTHPIEPVLLFSSGSLCKDAPNVSGIYGIFNHINEKWYIGQTYFLKKRANDYLLIRCSGQPLIYKALKRYGVENFSCYALEITKELNLNETKWILKKNSLAPNGYNLTTGGDNGFRHSAITIKKMSEMKKNQSVETRSKISNALRGRRPSQNTLDAVSLAKKGSKWSVEQRIKTAKTKLDKGPNQNLIDNARSVGFKNKGKIRTKEARENVSKALKEAWASGKYSNRKARYNSKNNIINI